MRRILVIVSKKLLGLGFASADRLSIMGMNFAKDAPPGVPVPFKLEV